jgi:hypothetical protein
MFTTLKVIVQSLGVQEFIAFNTMLGSFVHDWTFRVANIIVGGATLTTRDLVDDVIILGQAPLKVMVSLALI